MVPYCSERYFFATATSDGDAAVPLEFRASVTFCCNIFFIGGIYDVSSPYAYVGTK